MYVVFVNFFKFVICCDFFCHSKHIFTFCILFLKAGPRNCKSFRPHKVSTYPRPCFSLNLCNMYMHDAVHNGLFITVSTLCFVLISYNMQTHDAVHHCLSPSVPSVLFWTHTICTRMMMFITVYHLPYSVFHSELVQHADERRYSSPSHTGVFKDMTCRPHTASKFMYTVLSMILFQLQNVAKLGVKEFLIFKLNFVKCPPAQNHLISLEVILQHKSAKTKHFSNVYIKLR